MISHTTLEDWCNNLPNFSTMNPCFDQSETTFPLATTKIQHPSQKRLKKARSNALHAVFQDVTAFINMDRDATGTQRGKR
ncbi:hypothetical protein DXF93_17290 [Escherichia coli]|nr:hypothetical protein C2U51_09115 [Enterobacteriaceae bacterium ENNIH1]RDT53446.1 hypothetical protein DXF93_17290 [Escherichia coli]